MKIFDFSQNIINTVIKELLNAEKFIHIAIFQIHRKEIFETLQSKLKQGVEVEIFTLPYESIHGENPEIIIKRLKNLEKNGALVHFCRWNVGNPSRTTTAVGLWFSFHGKFIITDKCAISLSANFTEKDELDAILLYKKDNDKIKQFEKQFERLKTLFILKQGDFEGSIHNDILNTGLEHIERVFRLPNNIEKTYEKHWIQDYPIQIFSESKEIEDKLYLIPLDFKGRNLFKKIISKADKFVYISTETFTDRDFPDFLKEIALKNINIKILSGIGTMDFSERVQKMFREMLAVNILINTTEQDLHAKLLITDKHLVLSSINLNKISLGFRRKIGFWRENTETVNICSDKEMIEIAAKKFEQIFDSSGTIKDKLSEKLGENLAGKVRSIFDVSSVSGKVKKALGSLILRREIENNAFFIKISQILSLVLKKLKKKKLNVNHFNMALILYCLDKKKLNLTQIKEKIENLGIEFNIDQTIESLQQKRLISVEDNQDIHSNLRSNQNRTLLEY